MNRLQNMQSGQDSFVRNMMEITKENIHGFFRKRLESYLYMYWKMPEYTNVRPREEKHLCDFLKHYKMLEKRQKSEGMKSPEDFWRFVMFELL